MFKQGQKLAKNILVEMFGEDQANRLWGNINWKFSSMLPKAVYEMTKEDMPEAWAGFCCPMSDGTNTIIINKRHHNDAEEIAYTIGHELAHALQNLFHGVECANHEDEIFNEFKRCFSLRLGFEEEGF